MALHWRRDIAGAHTATLGAAFGRGGVDAFDARWHDPGFKLALGTLTGWQSVWQADRG